MGLAWWILASPETLIELEDEVGIGMTVTRKTWQYRFDIGGSHAGICAQTSANCAGFRHRLQTAFSVG